MCNKTLNSRKNTQCNYVDVYKVNAVYLIYVFLDWLYNHCCGALRSCNECDVYISFSRAHKTIDPEEKHFVF